MMQSESVCIVVTDRSGQVFDVQGLMGGGVCSYRELTVDDDDIFDEMFGALRACRCNLWGCVIR